MTQCAWKVMTQCGIKLLMQCDGEEDKMCRESNDAVIIVLRLSFEKFLNISQEFPEKFSGISCENSGEILRNFSKLSLKTMNPKKSLKLGTKSGEFLENFRGIIHKNLFSRNSSEILQSKSPKLENLGKIPTFVTWE